MRGRATRLAGHGRLLAIVIAAALLAPPRLEAASAGTAEAILASVVAVRAKVPSKARTARTLGSERRGNGVVIADPTNQGGVLILTIGYLVIEADDIEITDNADRTVSASLVGYDPDSGLGLLRPAGAIEFNPIALGDSAEMDQSKAALVAGHGGVAQARAVKVVARRPFAGGWEYLIEDAIFTTPPYPEFGGAALIAPNGTLVGIGSLILSEAAAGVPGNMFVPTDRLKPILADLVKTGRTSAAPKPWLGINTQEIHGQLFVTSVSPDGPAQRAGVHENDIVLGVHGQPVKDLPDFYRKLWAEGPAGTEIPLNLLQGRMMVILPITSVDRTNYLHLNPTY